jgi:hypothetical protein
MITNAAIREFVEAYARGEVEVTITYVNRPGGTDFASHVSRNVIELEARQRMPGGPTLLMASRNDVSAEDF